MRYDERPPPLLTPDERRLWGHRPRGRLHTRALLREISRLRKLIREGL